MFRDGTGRFFEDIRKNLVELEVGNDKTILNTALPASDHAGELETVSYQIPKLSNIIRRDKGWLDHVAHIQVAAPLGILAFGLVVLHGLGVL